MFLFDSEGFTQSGNQKLPSRFLKEIGEDNYTRIGVISKDLQGQADDFVAKQSGETPPAYEAKNIGDRVDHPAFGSGIIIEKTQHNYRIKFDKLNSDRVMSAEYFNKKHTLPNISYVEEPEHTNFNVDPNASSFLKEYTNDNEKLPVPKENPSTKAIESNFIRFL